MMDSWGKGSNASQELSGKGQFGSSYLGKETINPVRNAIMMHPVLMKWGVSGKIKVLQNSSLSRQPSVSSRGDFQINLFVVPAYLSVCASPAVFPAINSPKDWMKYYQADK